MADRDSVDFCVDDITSYFREIDPEVEGIVDRVSAINKHVSRAFEETLAHHGLNHGEYKLLLRLRSRSTDRPMSAGDLAKSLVLSTGAITNRLDRLESAGLIRRVRDARDRRGVWVQLTADGERTIDVAVTEQAARESDVLSSLSRTDMAGLNRLLRKVLRGLEAADPVQSRAG